MRGLASSYKESVLSEFLSLALFLELVLTSAATLFKNESQAFVRKLVSLTVPPDKDLKEYCQWEDFEATCKQDEVVIITDALYGRMRYGRCMLPGYDNVGCSANVRSLADVHCSGKQQCRITVPDKLFDGMRPCREDLKLYLLIGYRCTKVLRPASGECMNPPTGPESQSGLLASTVTTATGCGSVERHWVITVGPGQRVNISLSDYTRSSMQNSSLGARSFSTYTVCRVYGVIKDAGTGRSFTMCGGLFGREKEETMQEFLSDTNSVEIRLPSVKTSKDEGQFIFTYEAVGCPDVMTSSSQLTWRRAGQNASFSCDDGRVWHVTCQGRTWLGAEPTNCSESLGALQSASVFFRLTHFGATLVVIIIAVAVGLMIFICGVLFFYKKRRRIVLQQIKGGKEHTKVQSIYCHPDVAYQSVKWSGSGPPYPYSHRGPPRSDTFESDGNEYAYVDELQLPPVAAHGYMVQRNTNAYGLLSHSQQAAAAGGGGGGCFDGVNSPCSNNDYSMTSQDYKTDGPCRQSQYFTLKRDNRSSSLPHGLDVQ